MIPRRESLLFALRFGLAALSLLTVACNSVPLLAPNGSSITLTATATALPLNGTTDLIATVVQASGTAPQSGTHVIFTTSLGSIQPSDGTTDGTGRVVVKFNSGTSSGTATITASSGGANVGAMGAVKIAVGAAAVSKIAINANPSTVPVTGGNSTITATILDINGNALPNLPVTFSTTAGTVNPTVVNTDAGGNAQTSLFTNKTATVTATAGTQGSGTPPAAGGGATPTPTTASNQVIVTVNQVATIKMETPSPSPAFVGQSVTFPLTITPNANGSAVQRVVMDWGDGTAAQTFTGTPTAVTHTFTVTGTFSVRATLFDVLGDFSTGFVSLLVQSKPQPAVQVSASANPTAGTPTIFTISVTPAAGTTIQDVRISYGDGGGDSLGPVSGTGISATHVYTTGGTYRVAVSATDSNGTPAEGATVIFVQDLAPLAVGVTAGKAGSLPNVLVTFTATVTPPPPAAVVAQYSWHFGDGSTDQTTGSNQITHNYTLMGTYTVVVTVTTTRGLTTTGTIVVGIP